MLVFSRFFWIYLAVLLTGFGSGCMEQAASTSLSSTASSSTEKVTAQGGVVSVDLAKKITAVAADEARKNGWHVAIAITDKDGKIVHYERSDSGQAYQPRLSNEYARGLPLISDGRVIGGIGVTGGDHIQNEQLAKVGAAILK